jgi:hypothetical protein
LAAGSLQGMVTQNDPLSLFRAQRFLNS